VIRKDYLPFGKPNFSDEEVAAVTRVLRSGWLGMGSETVAFERELAEYVDAPHVVAVNSCTSALFLSLLVLGVGPGDEVICPSLTWCSTANVAMHLGAKPVFCDVDPDTLCVTPELVLQRVTSRTKAVMVVHMGGIVAEVEEIRSALKGRVAIVEDAAHALGAKFRNGRPVGSSGELTCFSFYANKNLSSGEGGAVALFDRGVADRLRSLRQNAMPIDAWQRFTHPKSILYSELSDLGYKMNYTDLQACIARVQLRRQPEFYVTRLEIAKRYCAGLRSLPIKSQLNILDPYHARHLFLIRLTDECLQRDEILLKLRARNIGASIHYAPLHLMPLYKGLSRAGLPNTEAVARCIMTLPISGSMTAEDGEYVVEHLAEIMQEKDHHGVTV
jgi:perosamine synthetase